MSAQREVRHIADKSRPKGFSVCGHPQFREDFKNWQHCVFAVDSDAEWMHTQSVLGDSWLSCTSHNAVLAVDDHSQHSLCTVRRGRNCIDFKCIQKPTESRLSLTPCKQIQPLSRIKEH